MVYIVYVQTSGFEGVKLWLWRRRDTLGEAELLRTLMKGSSGFQRYVGKSLGLGFRVGVPGVYELRTKFRLGGDR